MPALQTSRADFFSFFKLRVFVAINRYSFKTFSNSFATNLLPAFGIRKIITQGDAVREFYKVKLGKQGSVAALRHKRKFVTTNSFPATDKHEFGAPNFFPAFDKHEFGATNSFTTTDKRKFVTTNSFSAVNKRKIGVTNSLPSVNKRKFVAQEDIIREFYFVKLGKRDSVAALRQKHIKGADL